jgi:membrane protease YdiL (CAAX protease family)
MKKLVCTLVAVLAFAALAVPAAVAGGTLDSWQQNLKARAKYAQVTDPWALNLFARNSHVDRGSYTAIGPLRSVSTSTTTAGFDWAEFGIGAASMLAVVLFAGFAAVGIQRTRRHAARA